MLKGVNKNMNFTNLDIYDKIIEQLYILYKYERPLWTKALGFHLTK
jgi:hypothetical protein